MSNIIIRIPKKRHQGLSKSGKAHTFLTSGYGGKWYNIPMFAINKIRHFEKRINDVATEPYMEVTFDNRALSGSSPLCEDLKNAIDLLNKSSEATVIR